jgi:ATP-binding cassette subfamily B protein
VPGGLRQPAAGFILASGLDRHTLGDLAWRRRVAAGPEFQQNHILSASLGFNLLLAQPYPHSPEREYSEAQDIRSRSELKVVQRLNV